MKFKLPFMKAKKSVAVVHLSGVISGGSRGQLNDKALAPVLEKAFSKGKPDAVALVINSPGGSPVQSSLIGARIRRLAAENSLPVFAFVEDVAASGGYWLAVTADEIYVDDSSILGSIGVISAGFGAHDLLQRYGIERRVYTAGASKSTLDPFKPEKPEDVDRLKKLLEQIHSVFIAHVTKQRGAKLSDDEDLFTGEIWVGEEAVSVGLADGLGHLVPVMKQRFGENVKFRTYGQKKGVLQRFSSSLVQSADLYFEKGRRSAALVCDMIVKIVFLFLIGIAVLAMFGRIKLPGQTKLEAMRCNACGRFRLGTSGCSCGSK
jgi:serine protease SohB